MWCWFNCCRFNVDLFGFIYSDCPLSICFLASVCSDSPNPSAFSASISTLSKAVQMAFSQRLIAVVLRSVTNELFYCLFPSLCTDGRILSTSFYCCWMDSARCMHSTRCCDYHFYFSGFYRYIFFHIVSKLFIFSMSQERKGFGWSHICAAIAQVLGVNPPILFFGSSNMIFVSISRPNWNGFDQLYHTNLGENWYPCLSHLNTPP